MTAYRPDAVIGCVIGCKLKQNANEGCNSCASLAGLVLCFIARFILLVIAPLHVAACLAGLCSSFGDSDIAELASEAMVRSRRRRSSVAVLVCFVVVVVADFTRHHSAAAADADVAKQLAKIGNEDLDSDENDLIVAAKGIVVSCL